jgi:hypothetical protein
MCRGVGPRALSNGINSAVFFCFFEALRGSFKKRKALVSPANQVQCIRSSRQAGVLDDVLKIAIICKLTLDEDNRELTALQLCRLLHILQRVYMCQLLHR